MLKLLDSFKYSRKRVLCYLNGAHHFLLLHNLIELNHDIDFFILTRDGSKNNDDFRKSNLYSFDNVYFIPNFSQVLYKAHLFGLFITTDACMVTSHEEALKFMSFFRKISIPVVELQHGLFQIGLHYYKTPLKTEFMSETLPAISFADYSLTYYPCYNNPNQICIGYPPFYNLKKTIHGEYILILTNLHWSIYSDEERYLFCKTIFEFASRNKDKLFIWRGHHGENLDKRYTKMLVDLSKMFPLVKNIIFTNSDKFFNSDNVINLISLQNLIRTANSVICTVSTILLDCEMYNKEVFLFNAKLQKNLINKIKSCCLFYSCDDLVNQFDKKKKLVTGKLLPYNNDTFKSFVNRVYKVSSVSKDLLFDSIMWYKSLK